MLKTVFENKLLYVMCAVSLLCISMSIITTNFLAVAAFAIFLSSLVLTDINTSFVLLFGLLPFANIFKMNPGSTSFFTMCELIVVILAFFKIKKHGSFLLMFVVFGTYVVAFAEKNASFVGIIKLLIGFLIIYTGTRLLKKKDVLNIAYLMSVSTAVMLLLSQNKQYYLKVMEYCDDANLYVNAEGVLTDINRLGGFFGDPNYCSIVIIIALTLLSILYYYKVVGIEFWVIAAVLVPLGFFTYSKSYFLCIALWAAILMMFVLFPKHKVMALIAAMGIYIALNLILTGRIEVINMVLERFSSKDLTTGRNSLNKIYMNYITENKNIFLFGAGALQDRFQGVSNNVHNMYIEMLFKFGIVGSILYILTVISSLNTVKALNTENDMAIIRFMPIMFMLMMYYFLAGINRYELPFYVVVAYLGYNYNRLQG